MTRVLKREAAICCQNLMTGHQFQRCADADFQVTHVDRDCMSIGNSHIAAVPWPPNHLLPTPLSHTLLCQLIVYPIRLC